MAKGIEIEGIEVVSAEETTVQINGETFDIPRGEPVTVPADVAAILEEGGFLADPEV